jgi:hypothetical protein
MLGAEQGEDGVSRAREGKSLKRVVSLLSAGETELMVH